MGKPMSQSLSSIGTPTTRLNQEWELLTLGIGEYVDFPSAKNVKYGNIAAGQSRNGTDCPQARLVPAAKRSTAARLPFSEG